MYKTLSTFIILSLFTTTLTAENYENSVLNIFSKIMPRLILMSSESKLLKNDVNICIVHEKMDTATATLLKDKINENYPHGIKEYAINLQTTLFTTISTCKHAHLIFLLNSDDKNIKDAVDYANTYSILSAAYDASLLQSGVDTSILIGRKVQPFINLKAIANKGIKFNSTLIQVSKIYNEGEELVYPFNTDVLRFSMTKH